MIHDFMKTKTVVRKLARQSHWLRRAGVLLLAGGATGLVHAQSSWNWNGGTDGNWQLPPTGR